MHSKNNKARANQIGNYFLSDFCGKLEDAREDLSNRVDYLNNPIVEYLPFTEKVKRLLEFNNYKIYCAIISISAILSVLAFLIIKLMAISYQLKLDLFGHNIVLMLAVSCASACLASYICEKVAVTAEGSGIPELKTVFSGVDYYDFMDMKALLAKYTSIFFVKVAGLGIGFEAAFVHITACIGEQFTKIKFFEDLRHNVHDRKLAIAASIAAGIVIVFGSPIGGVVFAIELISSNFQVSHLFKNFVGAAVSFAFYVILSDFFFIESMPIRKNFEYYPHDLQYFVLEGLFMGMLSSIYLFLFAKYLMFKRASTLPIFRNRYYYLILITIIINLINHPHITFNFGFKTLISDMIYVKDLQSSTAGGRWWYGGDKIMLELLYVISARLIAMVLFTTAAIPFGIFNPAIIIGSFIGRLYGEVLNRYFHVATPATTFAIVGLAPFVSTLTRSFAPFIIVVEMTGCVEILLPLLLAVVFAFSVTGTFSIGFYEFIITMRNLPYLSTILQYEKALQPISEVMYPVHICFSTESSIFDVLYTLRAKTDVDINEQIPVVQPGSKRIIAYLKINDLMEFLSLAIEDLKNVFHHKTMKLDQASPFCKQFFLQFDQHVYTNKTDVFDHIIQEMENALVHVKFTNHMFSMKTMEKGAKYEERESVRFSKDSKSVTLIDKNYNRYTMRQSLVFDLDKDSNEMELQENMDRKVAQTKHILANIRLLTDDQPLYINYTPLRVYTNTKMSQIHYMFLMLQVDEIFVENWQGEFVGRLSLTQFLKFKHE